MLIIIQEYKTGTYFSPLFQKTRANLILTQYCYTISRDVTDDVQDPVIHRYTWVHDNQIYCGSLLSSILRLSCFQITLTVLKILSAEFDQTVLLEKRHGP